MKILKIKKKNTFSIVIYHKFLIYKMNLIKISFPIIDIYKYKIEIKLN